MAQKKKEVNAGSAAFLHLKQSRSPAQGMVLPIVKKGLPTLINRIKIIPQGMLRGLPSKVALDSVKMTTDTSPHSQQMSCKQKSVRLSLRRRKIGLFLPP